MSPHPYDDHRRRSKRRKIALVVFALIAIYAVMYGIAMAIDANWTPPV